LREEEALSRIAIFEGAEADASLAPVKKTRRGYKRTKTSPKQEQRQGKFKTCVRECKGTGKYRVCMSGCLKRVSTGMSGVKRNRK
jgi:hypothetical protein